jgi:hypothetical protein
VRPVQGFAGMSVQSLDLCCTCYIIFGDGINVPFSKRMTKKENSNKAKVDTTICPS